MVADGRQIEKALRGFESVRRFWESRLQHVVAKIMPGELYVTKSPELIATVLGSCVSACVRDPVARVGGMNHFMLPESDVAPKGDKRNLMLGARYGNFAMESLINEILKNGGDKRRLEVKVVGGGNIIPAMTDIGRRNIDFVLNYLSMEQFKVYGRDLGGNHPRKVVYDPMSGDVKVKKLSAMGSVIEQETRYSKEIDRHDTGGEIDLF